MNRTSGSHGIIIPIILKTCGILYKIRVQKQSMKVRIHTCATPSPPHTRLLLLDPSSKGTHCFSLKSFNFKYSTLWNHFCVLFEGWGSNQNTIFLPHLTILRNGLKMQRLHPLLLDILYSIVVQPWSCSSDVSLKPVWALQFWALPRSFKVGFVWLLVYFRSGVPWVAPWVSEYTCPILQLNQLDFCYDLCLTCRLVHLTDTPCLSMCLDACSLLPTQFCDLQCITLTLFENVITKDVILWPAMLMHLIS